MTKRSTVAAVSTGDIAPGDSAPRDSATEVSRTRTRAGWRKVAVPSEHGGWALTIEPVLLGLLIAPSVAGAAVGAAALLAFLARTPLRVVLVDRWRHRRLPRTRLAALIALAEVSIIVLLFGVALRTGDGDFWIPLLIAVPLVLTQLWFDMRSRSRRLVPELAGTIGVGSVAAAIVLAGGAPVTVAAGAWLLIAARAVASLPFVRYQLGRAKHEPHRRWTATLGQLLGVALAGVGLVLGWVSWPAAAALGVLVLVQFVFAYRPPGRAVIVGVQQLTLGLAVMFIAGLTMA